MTTQQIESMAHMVYSKLGAGFSERVYHNAMEVLLRKEGIPYETERIVPVVFEGHTIGNMRADLIVNREIVVELKATKVLTSAMTTQARKYLQLLQLPLALLVNFPQPLGLEPEIAVVEA